MTKQIESPNTIHGRLKEGAHIAGYSLERALENFQWLLEERRWETLGFTDVNEFLRDTEGAFSQFRLLADQRKKIVKLIAEQEPAASQRAIAGVVGVDEGTIRGDLRPTAENSAPKGAKKPKDAEYSAPPTTRTEAGEAARAAMKLNEPGYHKGDQSPEWETPQWLFDLLDNEFHFRLDVCATQENAKCKRHFTSEEDGLAQRWKGVCWMNPPYGHEIGIWMEKARMEADAGATIVCLVPARLDPEWMRTSARRAELRSIPGRLNFSGGGPAPFPSMVVIMRPSDHRDNPLFWDVWPPEEEKDNGLGEE